MTQEKLPFHKQLDEKFFKQTHIRKQRAQRALDV